MMKIIQVVAVAVLLFVFSLGALAQTPTPPNLLESAWHVQLGGGYNLTSNEGTNNGFASSIALRVGNHWSVRADIFSVNSPATLVTLIGPEFRWSLAQWVRPNDFINTGRFLLFVNAKAGSAKNSNDVKKLAYSLGGGIELPVSETFSLRPLDVSYVRASLFQGGGIWLGNHMRLASGIGLRF